MDMTYIKDTKNKTEFIIDDSETINKKEKETLFFLRKEYSKYSRDDLLKEINSLKNELEILIYKQIKNGN